MTTAIEPQKTFEERMMDRVRESIGDLLSDEDLKKIVERGIDKAFFERKDDPKSGWGKNETLPSVADKIIEKHFSSAVSNAVGQWLADHESDVKEAVNRAVAQGVGGCVIQSLDYKFGAIFNEGIQRMYDQGFLKRPGT